MHFEGADMKLQHCTFSLCRHGLLAWYGTHLHGLRLLASAARRGRWQALADTAGAAA